MAISPVGFNPNFTAKAKTEKGNEYETCNTGKAVGTTAGAAIGALNVWRTSKVIDKVIDKATEEALKFIKEETSDGMDDIFKHGKKIGKTVSLVSAAIGGLLLTAVGFITGKVYDNIQNEKREKAADSAAETTPANQPESAPKKTENV